MHTTPLETVQSCTQAMQVWQRVILSDIEATITIEKLSSTTSTRDTTIPSGVGS